MSEENMDRNLDMTITDEELGLPNRVVIQNGKIVQFYLELPNKNILEISVNQNNILMGGSANLNINIQGV